MTFTDDAAKLDLMKKWGGIGPAIKKALREGACSRLEGILATWADALAEQSSAVPLEDLKILHGVVNSFDGHADCRQTYSELMVARVEANSLEALQEAA